MDRIELQARLRQIKLREAKEQKHRDTIAELQLKKLQQQQIEKKIAQDEFDPDNVLSKQLDKYANDDNIYYNILISNTTSTEMAASSLVRKSDVIIQNPSQYYLSIIRFNLPGQAIPIFVFQPDTYWVTLVDTIGTPHPVALIYQSNTTFPNPISGSVYNYQQFLDMINVAFQSAYTACGVNVPSGMTQAPYMTLNRTTSLFSLWCQTAYDPSINNPTVQIWMNDLLYYFFDNFLTIYNGEGNANHQDYQFKIENYYNNIVTVPSPFTTIESPPGTYTTTPTAGTTVMYQFEQEFNSIYNWQAIQTISFRTTIPVRNEYLPAGATDSTQIGTEQVFIDFEPLATGTPGDYRGYFQYYREDNYRLTDVLSNEPLTEFSVDVYWKDHLNVPYQIYIPPGKTLSIKMLFVKKDLYKNK